MPTSNHDPQHQRLQTGYRTPEQRGAVLGPKRLNQPPMSGGLASQRASLIIWRICLAADQASSISPGLISSPDTVVTDTPSKRRPVTRHSDTSFHSIVRTQPRGGSLTTWIPSSDVRTSGRKAASAANATPSTPTSRYATTNHPLTSTVACEATTANRRNPTPNVPANAVSGHLNTPQQVKKDPLHQHSQRLPLTPRRASTLPTSMDGRLAPRLRGLARRSIEEGMLA